MNSPTNKAFHPRSGSSEAEETLRLIANLPAPQGLEDRVQSALRKAPRRSTLLNWPAGLAPARTWMRGAAAAAIVFVVVGGGWGVYLRVQPVQAPKVIAMPRVSAGGGFSSAGAMRTPQTLNGPVLVTPATKPANGTVGTGTKKVIPIKSAVNKIGHVTKAAAAAR
jgi:hypothetical protein